MDTRYARNGQVEIAYETFGDPGGHPLLLLSGLDYQMVWWPEEQCEALAARGFHVARFDYRDTGLSTAFTSPASQGGNAWKAMLKGSRNPAYSGQEMVEDILAVLDALGWERAHLLGVSMGAGMAQFLALLHPGRVRSLTLISGIPMGGSPLGMLRYMHLGAFAKLATRRYGPARQDQERMLVDVLRATYTDRYSLDEAWARRTATVSYDRRPPDPAARARQLAAGRTIDLPAGGPAAIRVPTLIIHGEDDPLIRLSASRALAGQIPGARLVTYPGMGHGLPPALWPAATEEISALIRQAVPNAAPNAPETIREADR
jgi:pimeloyl-ACP methyl ester carboxylesterase